jgi:hypothetical protein
MVPVERIELPTFGLQNRCSTAELNRRIEAIGARRKCPPLVPILGGSNIRLGRKGPEPLDPVCIAPAWKRRTFQPPFQARFAAVLLAEIPLFAFRLSQTGLMPITGKARGFAISVVRPANRCEVPASCHLKDREI